MPRGGGLVALALLFGGCDAPGRGAKPTEPPPEQEMTVRVRRPAEPASLADLAPGDTNGILALIRGTMRSGDAILDSTVRRDTTLPGGVPESPRRLSLWTLNDRPIKLVAVEPNDTDRLPGEIATWFYLGDIDVVQYPGGVLLFSGDGIVFATDESLDPVALPDTTRMRLEREVVDSTRARLAVFGLPYP